MFGLEKMRVIRLRCVLRSESRAILPPFLGSTLRGAVAGAMRSGCCGGKRDEKEACEETKCPFLFCFSPAPCVDPRTKRKIENPPRPLFFVAPPIQSPIWGAGQLLSFGIVIVGEAALFLWSVVSALQAAAENGLGFERFPFSLVSVYAQMDEHRERLLWAEGRTVSSDAPVFSFAQEPLAQQAVVAVDTVCVRLLSPLRLVERGKLLTSPSFHSFLVSLLGRLSALLSVYCGAGLDVEFRDVLQRAKKVGALSCELEEVSMDRWSNRQQKKIPIDGVMGTVLWQGEVLSLLWPILVAGSWVQCGKGTSFGLGQYSAERVFGESN